MIQAAPGTSNNLEQLQYSGLVGYVRFEVRVPFVLNGPGTPAYADHLVALGEVMLSQAVTQTFARARNQRYARAHGRLAS